MREVYHQQGHRSPRGKACTRMKYIERAARSFYRNAYKKWPDGHDTMLRRLLSRRPRGSVESVARRVGRSQSAVIIRLITRYGVRWAGHELVSMLGRPIRRYDK